MGLPAEFSRAGDSIRANDFNANVSAVRAAQVMDSAGMMISRNPMGGTTVSPVPPHRMIRSKTEFIIAPFTLRVVNTGTKTSPRYRKLFYFPEGSCDVGGGWAKCGNLVYSGEQSFAKDERWFYVADATGIGTEAHVPNESAVEYVYLHVLNSVNAVDDPVRLAIVTNSQKIPEDFHGYETDCICLGGFSVAQGNLKPRVVDQYVTGQVQVYGDLYPFRLNVVNIGTDVDPEWVKVFYAAENSVKIADGYGSFYNRVLPGSSVGNEGWCLIAPANANKTNSMNIATAFPIADMNEVEYAFLHVKYDPSGTDDTETYMACVTCSEDIPPLFGGKEDACVCLGRFSAPTDTELSHGVAPIVSRQLVTGAVSFLDRDESVRPLSLKWIDIEKNGTTSKVLAVYMPEGCVSGVEVENKSTAIEGHEGWYRIDKETGVSKLRPVLHYCIGKSVDKGDDEWDIRPYYGLVSCTSSITEEQAEEAELEYKEYGSIALGEIVEDDNGNEKIVDYKLYHAWITPRSEGGGSVQLINAENVIYEGPYATSNMKDEFDAFLELVEELTEDIANKADSNHTHEGYAAADHTHEEYAAADHTHEDYAAVDHTHDGYATADHTHDEYAAADHTHEGYAAADHTHEGYASSDHTHDQYAAVEHTHEGYAAADHVHEGYAAAEHTHEGYAAANHTHEGYAAANHTHGEYALTQHDHPGYALVSNMQNIVNQLTGEIDGVKSQLDGIVDTAVAAATAAAAEAAAAAAEEEVGKAVEGYSGQIAALSEQVNSLSESISVFSNVEELARESFNNELQTAVSSLQEELSQYNPENYILKDELESTLQQAHYIKDDDPSDPYLRESDVFGTAAATGNNVVAFIDGSGLIVESGLAYSDFYDSQGNLKLVTTDTEQSITGKKNISGTVFGLTAPPSGAKFVGFKQGESEASLIDGATLVPKSGDTNPAASAGYAPQDITSPASVNESNAQKIARCGTSDYAARADHKHVLESIAALASFANNNKEFSLGVVSGANDPGGAWFIRHYSFAGDPTDPGTVDSLKVWIRPPTFDRYGRFTGFGTAVQLPILSLAYWAR